MDAKREYYLKTFCEYMKEPRGIERSCPHFSWSLDINEINLKQKAYQVIVGKDEKMQEIVWNSGLVHSEQMTNIYYNGNTFSSGTVYYYQITLYDQNDNKYISDISNFTTGILEKNNWDDKWIGAPTISVHTFRFRHSYTVKKKIKHAAAFIASPCYYVTTLNGIKCTDAVLEGTRTDFDKTILYRTYYLNDLIRLGENIIGIEVGNGWNGLVLGEKRVGIAEHLFAFQMRVEYCDGEVEWVTSNNEDWFFTEKGPIIYNSIYNGEVYDARREIDFWDSPEYGTQDTNTKWHHAFEMEPPAGSIKAQLLEPIRIVQYLSPKEIYSLNDGSYTIDFGQNYAGWMRITIQEKSGQEITLKYAELINEDKSINPHSLNGAKATDVYIARDNRQVTYEPRFTYHGFRYVQVSGLTNAPRREDVQGCVIHSDVERIGDFECDNKLINQLYRNIIWTERSNLYGIPTDCPQRDERLGWLNDMTVRNECALYNYKLVQLYRKWMGDVKDTQGRVTGAISDTAPYFKMGQRPADPVSSSFLLVAWNVYCHYRDIKIIEDNYDALKKWTAYLLRQSDEYIVRFSHMGDWAAPMKGSDANSIGAGAVSTITPTQLMATGYLFYNLIIMSKMAKVIGKKEDEGYYTIEATNAKNAFNEMYFNKHQHYYAENSQASNTLPLYLDMVDEQERGQVLNNLIDDIVNSNDYHTTTGNLCSRYIIEVLFQNKHADLAYRLLTQTSYPSWGYMIENGATTVWERWENIQSSGPGGGMASHNHPMNGAVGVCFHKYLAGIQVDEENPGFKNIIFAPVIPSELGSVSGMIETIVGRVSSSWEKTKDNFSLTVEVPFNCTGEVKIPLINSKILKETLKINGIQYRENNDFCQLRNISKDSMEFIVNSGKYIFEFCI